MTEKEIKYLFKLEEQKRETLLSKLEQLDDKLKNEINNNIWELKQNIRDIKQKNEKDIAIFNKELKSYKKELKIKEKKKYKDWKLWLSIIAISISLFNFFFKP